jgi:hypothetical protein
MNNILFGVLIVYVSFTEYRSKSVLLSLVLLAMVSCLG